VSTLKESMLFKKWVVWVPGLGMVLAPVIKKRFQTQKYRNQNNMNNSPADEFESPLVLEGTPIDDREGAD
jgi:hypothetical protein